MLRELGRCKVSNLVKVQWGSTSPSIIAVWLGFKLNAEDPSICSFSKQMRVRKRGHLKVFLSRIETSLSDCGRMVSAMFGFVVSADW
jgi:hypothetical protein